MKTHFHHTEEHKEKLRQSNLKTWSNPLLREKVSKNIKERIKNMSPLAKKKWLENTIKGNQSESKRNKSKETMLRLRQDPEWIKKSKEEQKKIDKSGKNNPFYGKKHTIESRLKVSKTKKESPTTRRGINNPAYIDGKGNERHGDRITFMQDLKYKLFKEAVLKRDNYTCQICGIYGVKFHIDHIKSYRDYINLRTDINNGRTLCIPCHRKTDNYGRKKDYANTTTTPAKNNRPESI